MRALLLLLIFVLAPAPARAADWEPHEDARFGYTVAVPPGFAPAGPAEAGEGHSFRAGASRLAVWGGNVVEDGFENAARAAMRRAGSAGWAIGDAAVTPDWASFTATQGQRLLHQRMIALCDGRYAAVALIYSSSERGRLDPVAERLSGSLAATGSGC